MFEFLKSNSAIAQLKKDHDTVKELFERFEQAKSRSVKRKIVREALRELKVHALIEEEMFYPAVRKSLGKDLMNEADEEHHVAKVLIAELDRMKGNEDHFDAKFKVLAENVRHHIGEEEGEMFPEAKNVKLDFEALNKKMLRRKKELLKSGIPQDVEHGMVGKNPTKKDSPARAARVNKPKKRTKK
jgi:hemerythrin superfamily protein